MHAYLVQTQNHQTPWKFAVASVSTHCDLHRCHCILKIVLGNSLWPNSTQGIQELRTATTYHSSFSISIMSFSRYGCQIWEQYVNLVLTSVKYNNFFACIHLWKTKRRATKCILNNYTLDDYKQCLINLKLVITPDVSIWLWRRSIIHLEQNDT